MAEFVVELYASRHDVAVLDGGAERIRLAAEELSRDGTPVRYLRRIFVPEDETCLLLYEAESAAVVREATRRAGVQFERVTEAVANPSEDEGGRSS